MKNPESPRGFLRVLNAGLGHQPASPVPGGAVIRAGSQLFDAVWASATVISFTLSTAIPKFDGCAVPAAGWKKSHWTFSACFGLNTGSFCIVTAFVHAQLGASTSENSTQ